MKQRRFPIHVLAFSTLLVLGGWTSAARVATHVARHVPRGIDAPFRDGVFQGRLAAEYCRPRLASVGRWSDSTDRRRFAAGFDTAYSLATRISDACRVPDAGAAAAR